MNNSKFYKLLENTKFTLLLIIINGMFIPYFFLYKVNFFQMIFLLQFSWF